MMTIFLKLVFMRMTGFKAHPFDKRWDALVNNILDEGEHVQTDKYNAKYIYQGQEYRIWLANGLFSIGASSMVKGEHVDCEMQKLPSIRTTLRIYKEVYLREVKRLEIESEQKAERLFS